MLRRLSFSLPSPTMAAVVVSLVAAGGGYALAATTRTPTIRACANKTSGALRLSTKCHRPERSLSWNQRGPQGPIGSTGATGATGATGQQGAPGIAGTARAYAHITRTDTGGLVLDASRSFNVRDAVLPRSDRPEQPCIVLPSSINADATSPIATVDAQNTPFFAAAVIAIRVGGQDAQGCPTNSVAVLLARNGGVETPATIAFNIVIP